MYYIRRYLKKIAQISLNFIFESKILLKKSHLLKVFVKYSSKIISFRNLWEDSRSNSSQVKILIKEKSLAHPKDANIGESWQP